MEDFSASRLQKNQRRAGSECFLRALRQEIRKNQRKITKSVYNLESRDIGKFTREWNQLRQKFKAAASDSLPSNKAKILRPGSKTYDENQTLEMSFEIPFRIKAPTVNESAPIRTQMTQKSQDELKLKPKSTVKNRYSLKIGSSRNNWPINASKNRNQLQNLPSSKDSRREARQRFVTQWQPETKQTERINIKKAESPPHSQQHLMTDLSRERIDQYIRNLHKLQWSSLFLRHHPQIQAQESSELRQHLRKFRCDMDSPIDEQFINYMVSRRYNLLTNYLQDSYQQKNKQLEEYSPKFKNIEQQNEVSLLDSLQHNSILKLIKIRSLPDKQPKSSLGRQNEAEKKHNKPFFSLPYSEFISYRQTKSTVYQLINMGSRTAQKVAFQIYDKNRNGVLDEDDLLQMISLSRNFAFVQADISIIARSMSAQNSKAKHTSSHPDSERTEKQSVSSLGDSGVSRRSKERNKDSQAPSVFLPIQEEEQSQNENITNELTSGRFKIDKLYTFLRGNQTESKKMQTNIGSYTIKPLTLESFCKAFRNEKPMILIDLFQFLFGAPIDHFHPNVQKAFAGLENKKQISQLKLKEQETLDEKWTQKIRKANAILSSFVKPTK